MQGCPQRTWLFNKCLQGGTFPFEDFREGYTQRILSEKIVSWKLKINWRTRIVCQMKYGMG